LKNGDSVKGTLENVDNFMNLKLKDIIYTSSDGNRFKKVSEGFIRGNNVNSIQFKEGLLEKIEEEKDLKFNMPGIYYINCKKYQILVVI
jgi:U6 snRNA-associated Sm-like protein LSm4